MSVSRLRPWSGEAAVPTLIRANQVIVFVDGALDVADPEHAERLVADRERTGQRGSQAGRAAGPRRQIVEGLRRPQRPARLVHPADEAVARDGADLADGVGVHAGGEAAAEPAVLLEKQRAARRGHELATRDAMSDIMSARFSDTIACDIS
jgi:hypothetical protein